MVFKQLFQVKINVGDTVGFKDFEYGEAKEGKAFSARESDICSCKGKEYGLRVSGVRDFPWQEIYLDERS